ncbi:chaplin [Streptomyces liangshanensis]|uniref:Chaplin n=1 Tax=Streptomyces liangshanensis TaxID=2717324 RepID=A0A6G9H1D6_9ACTN|nr:chaplin [Streptomyces liangshanensis]QIQ04343.1 chaplin [Streptomyces liangshanensis]
MRDLISKGLLTAAAASSVLSMTGGYAMAAEADGAAVGSPGVLSGNTIQAPLEVPVNVCGNTVDPVGALNPSFGNNCGSTSGSAHSSAHETYGRYAPQAPAAYRQAPAPAPAPAHTAPAPRPQAHENHPPAAPAPAHAAPAPSHAAPAPAHAAPKPAQAAPAPAPAHAAPKPAHAAPKPAHARPAPHTSAPAPAHAPAPAPVREHKPAPAPDPRPQPGPAVHEAPVSPRPHVEGAGSTHASGTAAGSPGVLAGNLLEAPVDLALNACGNTADVVGLLNPAFGNNCGTRQVTPPAPVRQVPPVQPPVDDRSVVPNTPVTHPNTPVPHHTAPPVVPAQHRPHAPARAEAPQLAETGGDHLLAAAAMSAGLLLGGGILYRRSTAKARV